MVVIIYGTKCRCIYNYLCNQCLSPLKLCVRIPLKSYLGATKHRIRLMVFNVTFINILVISWRSVLLVTYPDKTTNMSQVTYKLYHNMFIEKKQKRNTKHPSNQGSSSYMVQNVDVFTHTYAINVYHH
jgi:hypothetical protein